MNDPEIKRFGFNGFTIKWIALITMLIDHTGMVLFPQYIWLRSIGRIAFPLYCFLLVEGTVHTSNMKAYIRRIFLFALLSEIPFDLAHPPARIWDFHSQNIFFTLGLGLIAIYGLKEMKNQMLSALLIVLALLAAHFGNTDYGPVGVLFILFFYLLYQQKYAKIIVFSAINVLSYGGIQNYALLATPFMLLYNGKPGPKKLKYFFYIFYPVHLLVLAWIRDCFR